MMQANLELANYVARAFGAVPEGEVVAELEASNNMQDGQLGMMEVLVVTVAERARKTYTACRDGERVVLVLVAEECER